MSRSLGTSVSQKTNHETSERLRDLHPYFPEDHSANFSAHVDPYQVERAFGHRAVPKLVELLRFEELPDDSRSAALNILVGLTNDQREKQKAVAGGAIAACTELARETSTSVVRAGACSVLASLATLPQALELFGESETVAVLTAGIQAEEYEVREAASLAFLNLSGSRPGVDMLIAAGSVPGVESIREIVRALIGPSQVVSLYLVATLGNICRYDAGIELALGPGVVPKLVELLQGTRASDEEVPVGSPIKGPPPQGLRMQTVNAIWNIANSMDGKEELIDRDAVPALAKVLGDPSVEVRRCGSGALMALAVNELGKTEVSVHCASGLTRLLLDEDHRVRVNAKAAIINCSENRTSRMELVKELVGEWTGSSDRATELIIRVYGGSAAEPLAVMLRQDPDTSPETTEWERVAITACLCQMCANGHDDQVMSTLYVVESLANQLGGRAREHAAGALDMLCGKHAYALKRLRTWNSSSSFFSSDADIQSELGSLHPLLSRVEVRD